MLKNALTTDPSTDISAFKDILIKFCTGGFREDTIGLFRLAWMFAFLKNPKGDKKTVVAGEVLQKAAGKGSDYLGRRLVANSNMVLTHQTG